MESRIGSSSDDAEQNLATGAISTGSTDLELADDGAKNQLVGMRFTDLVIPTGAVITSAYIQFTVDEVSTGVASLTIGGELADNAQSFTKVTDNISSRDDTIASVAWTPPDWNTVGAEQETADISAVIQEIVDQSGWSSGNAIVLTITGSGERVAESYNGDRAAAPLLHIEYTVPDDGVPRIDLDGNDSSGAAGADFAAAFIADGAAVAIADTDTIITDSDGDTLHSASITITNAKSGDVLALAAGAVPTDVTATLSLNDTMLTLTGTATALEYAAAIEAITFENTLADPNGSDRTIEIVVNDGTTDSPTAITTVRIPQPAFDFLVIADVPYGGSEFEPLADLLADVSPDTEFVVHLGDITGHSPGRISADYFEEVSTALQNSPVPVFIVLGDNEFNDSSDPEQAFSFWSDSFVHFDQNWSHDLGTIYQDVRPENFSFVIDDTLFIGLNLVGSSVHDSDEWATRTADDIAWMQDMFGQFGSTASNAVLFGHASPGKSAYESFETEFISVAQDFQKPILYLQGDSHIWSLRNPYSDAPNITKVVVDRTVAHPPLEITVSDDADDPFSSDHNFDGQFL